MDDTNDFPVLRLEPELMLEKTVKRKLKLTESLTPVKRIKLDTTIEIRAELVTGTRNPENSSPIEDRTFNFICDQSSIFSCVDETITEEICVTKKHVCGKCGSTFSYEFSLTHHVKFQCGKTFNCNMCDSSYKSESGYNYHMKNTHRRKTKISKKFRGNQHKTS